MNNYEWSFNHFKNIELSGNGSFFSRQVELVTVIMTRANHIALLDFKHFGQPTLHKLNI